MITDKERSRFFVSEGDIIPGGESCWWIVDWDERRTVAVTIDEPDFDQDIAVGYLNRYIDQLEPDVVSIQVSPQGDLISTSSRREDDRTVCPEYVSLDKFQLPQSVETIYRSELVESRRLAPMVDCVMSLGYTMVGSTELAFKYYFQHQFWDRLWHELQISMRLPKHPHIVPFDRVVVDELGDKIVAVGFTSRYIPGDTIEQNNSRVFKLKYLRQLLEVVDDLNLKYGIAHQDIAPRNLLIDEKTDSLMIFDFNFSAPIDSKGYLQDRDDIKGVTFTLYEIITRDIHFRTIPFHQQNPADAEGLKEWGKHPDVRLDKPVSEYRQMLAKWIQMRRTVPSFTNYAEALKYFELPPIPDAPLERFPVADRQGNVKSYHEFRSWRKSRREAREKDQPVLNWQRPPRSKLGEGTRVLATGQITGSE